MLSRPSWQRTTSNLRDELLGLDVDLVRRAPTGPSPEQAKRVDLAAVGALLVVVQQSSQAVGAVLNVVRGWVERTPGRAVTVTIDGDSIEVTDASDEEQRQLVEAFVERHRTPTAKKRARRK